MDGKRDADRLKAAEMLGSIPGVNLWGKHIQAKEDRPVTNESRLLGLLERVTGVVKSDTIYDAEWSALPKAEISPNLQKAHAARARLLEAKKSGGATEAAPPEVREDETPSIPQSVDDQSTPDDDLWQDGVDEDDDDDDSDDSDDDGDDDES